MYLNKKIIAVFIFVLIPVFFLSGCASSNDYNYISDRGNNYFEIVCKDFSGLDRQNIIFEKEQYVSFIIDSNIKKGNLTIELLDSTGEVIENFEVDKKLIKNVRIKYTDVYNIRISCNDFTGGYEVKWQ